MSRHQKEITQKQKLIIYISCAIAAIFAAVGATFLVVHLVKNPPSFIFNSSGISYNSNFSTLSIYDTVIVPEATIIVTNDGAKQKVDKIVDASNQVEATRKNKIIVQNYKVDKSGFIKNKVKLPVEYLSQNPELPTGCEITALTTVLNFYGYDISKTEMSDNYLDKTIDQIGSFWEVYVGNPRKNGFGCYAKPIVNAANRYFSDTDNAYKAVDYSGAKFEDLLKLVESDTPVIIWSTMYGEEEKNLREPYATVQWNIDGKDISWIAPEHCMVLIGYDLDRSVAILSDPQRGIVEYDLDTVKARYLAMHSQCVVIEEVPMISGIEDGQTYYTTQCVVVSSHNLKSVTLDGEKVDSIFLIPGDDEDIHHVVVTDLDGNKTEITVYTKPITSLFDPIEGLNEFSVTIDNRSTILDIKARAQNCLTDYSPYKETQELDIVISSCDLMLQNIDAAVKEYERIKSDFAILEGGEITVNDIATITKLFEDIQAVISGGNLTQSQKLELATIRSKCSQWLSDAQT